MKWRLTVISIFVLLLSFLSLGAVKEYGNDIKYPVQSAFSITGFTGTPDKNQIFDKIEELAQKEHMQIYRPFLDSNSKEQTYVFGETKSDSAYVTNRSVLLTNDVNGMYYAGKSVPATFGKELEAMGLIYKGGDLPWYLMPVYFLFTNLRSLAIWTLFFVFALLLFAVKLMYAKKSNDPA